MDQRDPIRILLVDDDKDDCELFEAALSESSLPVILKTLCDGQDLLTELSSIDGLVPDVIFLDINMPKKNGREILDEIRSSEKFKDVPVIMFSTSTYKDDIDYSYEHGANLYIPKALFFSEQQNVIKALFSDEWEKYLTKIPKEKFVLSKQLIN